MLGAGALPTLTAEGVPVSDASEHTTMSLDPLTNIVRFARTDRPYQSADDVGAAFTVAANAFPLPARSDKMLLLDVRAAPARTDPRFAKIVAAEAPALFRGWRRVAMLVHSEDGASLLRALGALSGAETQVFHDEDAALVYLLA
jgi:hypothetical protein